MVFKPITGPKIRSGLMSPPPDPQWDVEIPEAGNSRLEASRQCFRAAVTDREVRLSALQATVRARQKAIAGAARAAKQ